MREKMLTTFRQSVCKIGGSAGPVKLKFALFFAIPAIVASMSRERSSLARFNQDSKPGGGA